MIVGAEDGKKRVVITGAAGNIGGKLRTELRHRYDLVLLDRRRLDDPNLIHADLTAYDRTDERSEDALKDEETRMKRILEARVRLRRIRIVHGSSHEGS